MSWHLRALIGPGLWAVAFAAIYALHGLGCAWGWPARDTLLGPLHEVVLIAGWVAALSACGALLLWRPAGHDREARLVRAGDWIGLVATASTLLPVIGVSSCA